SQAWDGLGPAPPLGGLLSSPRGPLNFQEAPGPWNLRDLYFWGLSISAPADLQPTAGRHQAPPPVERRLRIR
ncbi:hypothetical protein MC885_015283, partial [Smutsia gigantea]